MPSYSPQALRVMKLAHLEADRVGSPYIGSEHILLAIVKEDGLNEKVGAAAILRNLGVDLRKIRDQTEALLQPGPDEPTIISGS